MTDSRYGMSGFGVFGCLKLLHAPYWDDLWEGTWCLGICGRDCIMDLNICIDSGNRQ